MDDLLIKVVVRLASVYESLGAQVYAKAAHNALLAIARAVHDEAEKRARPKVTLNVGPVVKFPLGRARRRSQNEGGDDA